MFTFNSSPWPTKLQGITKATCVIREQQKEIAKTKQGK